jgi:hypothetical protein
MPAISCELRTFTEDTALLTHLAGNATRLREARYPAFQHDMKAATERERLARVKADWMRWLA